MSRSAAWREGYDWACVPTHKPGEDVSFISALESFGYTLHSVEGRDFLSGAKAALDRLDGRS